jgi:4-amino-4-deoxy-L-arabinose transferase-like glycosyltransferase
LPSALLPHSNLSPDSEPAASASSASRRLRWLVLGCLLFLLQVLPFLSYRWVTDESWYAAPGYSIAHGQGVRDPAIGPNDLESRFDARPPGTALLISAAFRAFGAGQVQARLASVLAGLLVVICAYAATRDVLDEAGAALAVLLCCTDNLLVLSSRTARPEALTAMSVAMALLAMKRYARTESVWAAAGAGLLMALGLTFHVTVIGYVLSMALLAIYLDHRKGRFILRGALAFSLGLGLGMLPFVTWILTAPLGREGFREEYLSRGHGALLERIVHEGSRYHDVLGLGMVHQGPLQYVPLRAFVPLVFIAGSVLLARYRRKWFTVELLLLVPTVLWFVEMVNKSSRYLTLLAFVFAVTIGAAVTVSRGTAWRRVLVWAAVVVVAAQALTNGYLLLGARKANYSELGEQLRQTIPAGEPVYGTITFWLALRDHTFISQERTTPEQAAGEDHVKYFLLGDRMMVQGSAWDADYYERMHRSLAEIQAKAQLVRTIPSAYYGQIEVYRLP